MTPGRSLEDPATLAVLIHRMINNVTAARIGLQRATGATLTEDVRRQLCESSLEQLDAVSAFLEQLLAEVSRVPADAPGCPASGPSVGW